MTRNDQIAHLVRSRIESRGVAPAEAHEAFARFWSEAAEDIGNMDKLDAEVSAY